ncbi:MAG: hypothetical protein EAZ55_00315 [Cytophagales bacterium]|nr:MAG: hypothetical protein EAZ55_00315 [Cytophagales bacterium]
MTFEFENKSLLLIEEHQEVIREIERAIFTNRYNLNNKHFTIFSTNSISILYSIWEGFIQKIFGLYIDEINKEEIDFFSFCDNIIIFCKERNFRQLKDYPQKTSGKISFMKKLKDFYSINVHLIPRVIDTQSNVGFEVLNRLLEQFNIVTYPEQWDVYKYPNPNLKENLHIFLKLRNTIAHGGELLPEESIDQKTYERFKKIVLDLMYDLRDKMLDSLINKKYKS